MSYFKLSITLVAAGALAACSSTMTRSDIAKDEAEAAKTRMELMQEADEMAMEQRQEELENTPDWVIEPPRPDETGFYGVGIGDDAVMALAIRKAQLQGQFELAQEINNELSGENTMSGYGEDEYRFIINAFVDGVDLTGTETVKREILVTADGYRVFTLTKLPYNEFNRILQDQAASPEKETIDEAYERLMTKVNADAG